ncbi:MAG: LysR family transcriptional regulator [Conexibacter sp.]|nr:LysR family transcriptional regulator [Conexibacter sp.]
MAGPPVPLGSPELDLRRLRYFVILAEELHFGRAAERAFVAQPSLSRQISQLEQQLGVSLFARTSRHVELTDAGRQLADDARDLLAAADATRERVIRAARGPRALAVGFYVGDNTIGPVTRAFRESHPDVLVDVRRIYWHDQTTGLMDGSSDVSFVHLPVDEEGLTLRLLHREERVAVVAADHPLASREHVTLAELDDPVILHRGASAVWEAAHNVDPRPDGRPVRPGPTVTCIEEKLEQVATGRAISFLPRSAAAMISLQPGVTALAVDDLPPLEICAAWRPARETPLILAFVAAAEALGDGAGPGAPAMQPA